MKKLLTVATLAILPLCLAACGNKEPEPPILDDFELEDIIVDETINEVEGLMEEVENFFEDELTVIEVDLSDVEQYLGAYEEQYPELEDGEVEMEFPTTTEEPLG